MAARTIATGAVRRLLALVSTTAVVACSDGGSQHGRDTAIALSPGQHARELAAATDRRLNSLTRKEGTLAGNGATSTYSAFLAGDAVRLIRERVDEATVGQSSNRYYFERGALIYYESDARERSAVKGASDAKHALKTVLALDSLGVVSDYMRTSDGVRLAIDSGVVAAIRSRAERLSQEAKKKA